MKIKILPPEVYNRIAAGEVVDRPYSVVKELVENAVDAGATEISVEIEQGGKKRIRVTDNGSGIARDDLQSAFLPHATSKLETEADLMGVRTLGFRGEAIASIASVSRMSILSKPHGAEALQYARAAQISEIRRAGRRGRHRHDGALSPVPSRDFVHLLCERKGEIPFLRRRAVRRTRCGLRRRDPRKSP